MSNDVIDWDKPLQTRDGRDVRIYTTEGADTSRPVVGEVKSEHGIWVVARWRIIGRSFMGQDPVDSPGDLVNVPQQN